MRTSMLRAVLAVTVVGVVGIACSDDVTAPVTAWEAALSGANEVPAVSPAGAATGTFTLNAAGDSLNYTVTITTATATAVTQAHIHTGNAGANGNISVWLCGTAANPGPTGTPTCAAGTAAGVLVGPAKVSLGATATARETLKASIRAFGTYANVHTATNTGGEMRGQLRLP